MRDFLDSILAFISSESLTDEEFETVDENLNAGYTKEVYLALRAILETRENVSWQLKKLEATFTAKGVNTSDIAAYTPTSNIFIGSPL